MGFLTLTTAGGGFILIGAWEFICATEDSTQVSDFSEINGGGDTITEQDSKKEFLMFYLRRKDVSGIENRYFDLLLVPILVCVVSTVFELKSSKMGLSYGRLASGVGLILQGMWFLQMGLSFYTGLITHGCSLHEKSRGNYTIKCKGHPEYHRARSIATLQFNCHLALLVTLGMVWYSMVGKKNVYHGDFTQYRPIGEEMQQMDVSGHFTLDSDEDEIGEEDGFTKMNVEVGVNSPGPHE